MSNLKNFENFNKFGNIIEVGKNLRSASTQLLNILKFYLKENEYNGQTRMNSSSKENRPT